MDSTATSVLAPRADRALPFARAVARIVAFGGLTIAVAFAQIIGTACVLFDRRRSAALRGRLMQTWARAGARVIGLRVRVEGSPPDEPHLLVSNHLGYLDILTLLVATPGTFLAKSEVSGWPGVGLLTRFVGTIFIDRHRTRDVVRVLDEMTGRLNNGENVAFFPEGTSTPGSCVLRFRSGLFDAASRTAVPVACATLSYETPENEPPATQTICWWGDMPFASHVFGLILHSRFDAVVRFSPKRLMGGDRKVLARDAQRAVHDGLPESQRRDRPLEEVERLTGECVALLDQGLDVLHGLTPDQLRWRPPGPNRGTAGDHLRHGLDHVACLVRDCRRYRVDYDRRARDPEIATELVHARSRIEELRHELQREIAFLPSIPLRVRLDAPDGAWVESNLSRELRSLASHTRHHYALIALILRMQGLDVPEEFGVAPSTLHARGSAMQAGPDQP